MDVFDDEIEQLAREVIGAAIEVHRHLGPGHPESAYCNALAIEFDLRGTSYEREYAYAIVFKDQVVGQGRLDFFCRWATDGRDQGH
jgi:GxxExxY protein